MRDKQKQAEYQKAYRAKNRERLNAYDREYGKKNPSRAAERKMLSKYGVGLEWYGKTLKEQGGCCAICRGSEPGQGRSRFYVDHDHQTGQVRGLLCNLCNSMIGYAREQEVILRSGIDYLAKFK